MSWRTVCITSRCKLDYRMGYMVVRGDDVKRIYLDEISVLVIENPAVSMTGCLLEELVNKKIDVIFCDSKRNPSSQLIALYGCHDSPRKVKQQIEWKESAKETVWARIVKEKILKQAEFLGELDKYKEEEMLVSYSEQIKPRDETNREGHAAKVYFNALFGMDFTRNSESVINAALNYGYSIILSAFNRDIVSSGYMTQFGIFHDNVFNQFNLSSDLMEPFRVLVDRKVLFLERDDFGQEEKNALVSILNQTVIIDGAEQTVLNAIKIYTRSVFEALNESDDSLIKFYGIC